ARGCEMSRQLRIRMRRCSDPAAGSCGSAWIMTPYLVSRMPRVERLDLLLGPGLERRDLLLEPGLDDPVSWVGKASGLSVLGDRRLRAAQAGQHVAFALVGCLGIGPGTRETERPVIQMQGNSRISSVHVAGLDV